MQVATVLSNRVQNYSIEGPTRTQARKMAVRRMELLALAKTALATGDDVKAFDYDCAALDIESDLITFGFEKLIK